MKRSKAYEAAAKKIDADRLYSPLEGARLAKDTATTKFDPAVEVALRLGVDPRKADQMVRGTVNLPHGTGKTARVLVFAIAVLVVSGLAMGMAPAWRLATTDVKTLMNESGRSATGGRGTSRLMGGMIIAEIALAITLVAGAGWLVQSFAKLRTIGTLR